MISSHALQKINQDIYRRFPEVSGKQPKVQLQTPPAGTPPPAAPTYLLTYSTKVTTPDQKTMPRWVRVVATEHGKVVKVTTSR